MDNNNNDMLAPIKSIWIKGLAHEWLQKDEKYFGQRQYC